MMAKSGTVRCGTSDPYFYALMKLLCLEGRSITEFTVHAMAGEVLTIETVEVIVLENGKPKRDMSGEQELDNHKYVLVEEQVAKEAGLI